MNRPPNREIEIFTEARSLPVEDRAAFLGRACGDDAELRQRVAALLQVHEQAGDFMESPAVDASVATDLAEALSQKPGDRIGRYKLLEKIGEGGCGVVYMAEQEEPVRRQVALKIVKAGMDTKSVIARFEAERQALALMDHPSIAKILDAGATASGRPYFVMELVRGTKITDYCNQHALSPRARLELFVQVCHAIEHAHQKGIIHRDIKPSNILVTENVGGVPVPVVIDFGIAKATMDQRLTDKTLFTAFEMLIGTPAYMSPEQAALTSGDVDTRTDIYSLGVLLYELLTGAPPFDTGELLKSGLDEVRRVIREREPPRPSTRLSTLSGEALTSIAQQRKLEAPALIRIVRGDLDWIAMRALEKDRTRRYETANGLALDVQHYLADEVISARPPSRLYRLRKMAARNPAVFVGSLTVVMLLMVSLVVVSTLLANERHALREMDLARRQAEIDKAKAQTESNKSQQITRFLEEMLNGVRPAVAQGRDTTMLREILDIATQRIQIELTDQPASRVHLQIVLGQVYFQLGAYNESEACLKSALATCRARAIDDGQETAHALAELSMTLSAQLRSDEAISAAVESIELRRRLSGNESTEVATSLLRLANAFYSAGRYHDGERVAREALDLRQRLLGSENIETAEALHILAAGLRTNGKNTEALTVSRGALAIRQKQLGLLHPAVAQSLQVLASVLASNKKWAEAEDAVKAAIETWRKIGGPQTPELFRALVSRGVILRDARQLPEAEAAFQEAVAAMKNLNAPPSAILTSALNALGATLKQLGKSQEAENAMREAVLLANKTLSAGAYNTALYAETLVAHLLDEGKVTDAENLLNEMLPASFRAKPESANLLAARVGFYARQGRWSEGAADVESVLAYQPDNTRMFNALALLTVEANDLDSYRKLFRRLEPFRGTKDVMSTYRILHGCMLLPSPEADFYTLKPFAEILDQSSDLAQRSLLQCCKALWEYRRGNYAGAVEWAEKSIRIETADAVRAEDYAILAMSYSRLGQEAKASEAFEQQVQLRKSLLRITTADNLNGTWKEWVAADIIMRESTRLLNPSAEKMGEKK